MLGLIVGEEREIQLREILKEKVRMFVGPVERKVVLSVVGRMAPVEKEVRITGDAPPTLISSRLRRRDENLSRR